jgi:acylphosphatase
VSACPQERTRLVVFVRGHVQGVGFRWWTRSRALELGLVGWARNLPDGRVEVLAVGRRPACQRLVGLLEGPAAPGRVEGLGVRWGVAGDADALLNGFVER